MDAKSSAEAKHHQFFSSNPQRFEVVTLSNPIRSAESTSTAFRTTLISGVNRTRTPATRVNIKGLSILISNFADCKSNPWRPNPRQSQNNANFVSNPREKTSDSRWSEGLAVLISEFYVLSVLATPASPDGERARQGDTGGCWGGAAAGLRLVLLRSGRGRLLLAARRRASQADGRCGRPEDGERCPAARGRA